MYRSTIECEVKVPTPTARYLDELFSLKCAGDIAHFFPNAKEVTESFTVFNAVRKVLGSKTFGDPSILCVCPGDGSKPRTAAVFAFRTAWQVVSVDPIMQVRYARDRHNVQRLKAHRCRIEGTRVEAHHVVVAACHSHARLSSVLDRIGAERIDVFSLPCCVADDIGTPLRSWRDPSCWSPENRVNYYHIDRT